MAMYQITVIGSYTHNGKTINLSRGSKYNTDSFEKAIAETKASFSYLRGKVSFSGMMIRVDLNNRSDREDRKIEF